MLIEIHLLQNHSPGNPNRDDMGAPKSAYFGGRLRGRISSQCVKRSIRLFPGFRENEELQEHLGTRTKFFPHLVAERLERQGCTIPAQEHARIVAACARIANPKKKEAGTAAGGDQNGDRRPQTPQLIYLGPGEVEEFVTRLERLRTEMPEHYAYYLDPVTGFQEEMKTAVGESDLDEDDQEKLIKNAWEVAKLRVTKLTKFPWEEEQQSPPGGAEADPGEAEARWIVERIEELSRREDKPAKDLLTEILKAPSAAEKKLLKGAKPDEPKGFAKYRDELSKPLVTRSVDIALFGRMTTSDSFEDVEACLEVAHAISTNEMVREVDYFTAVDDLGKGAAAAHVGENQFNSCTYYKYFSLDWKAFTDRVAGPNPTPEARAEAVDLARKAVRSLIHAAAHAVPTGKKKGHAHNNLPEAVLVEVKEKRVPTSYANAFLKPVVPPADGDLVIESVRQLGHYVGLVSAGYGLKPRRFWFDLNQKPLAIIRKSGNNQPPRLEILAESLPSFDTLLDAVDKALNAAGSER
jgi:CRISPR-associated protein Cas7/Cse4/CasC subtype I-E